MKVVALVSGGKDSCYAMQRCIDYGHEIVALANLLPMDDAVDELDSFMFQTVGHQMVGAIAECMGLPLFRRRIQGTARLQELRYKKTMGDEVEDLEKLLRAVKEKCPEVGGVSSGAIASDYQRLRVESVCSRLGLVSLAYLWKQDQALLLQQMIDGGIHAVLVKVAAIGMDPQKHLGKDLASLQPQFARLASLYGSNVCGEGGEYESLTLDSPLFKHARIVLDQFEVALHSPDQIAPVGVLHPTKFHLEAKPPASPEPSSVFEVTDDAVTKEETVMSGEKPAMEEPTADEVQMLATSQQHGLVTLGCWRQPTEKKLDVRDELGRLLSAVEATLQTKGLTWGHVLYVRLFLEDMADFASANEVYVRHITEGKCERGVPSRCCMQVCLPEGAMGRALLEVAAAADSTKQVLHVQSISCWAPSCIGPYSQATLHRNILHMAGQLGLYPPTMTLVLGGATSEMRQALYNCEAVAGAFNASLRRDAVALTVYCADALSAEDQAHVELVLKNMYDKDEVGDAGAGPKPADSRFGVPNPLVLYVLVPALPKGAAVEVEPSLFAPASSGYASDDDDAGPRPSWQWVHIDPPTESTELMETRGAAKSTGTLTCSPCEGLVLKRRYCRALVCIGGAPSGLRALGGGAGGDELEQALAQAVGALCGILEQASLGWSEVSALRIYFDAKAVAAATLRAAVMAAVQKAAGAREGGPHPFLIPVSGVGRTIKDRELVVIDIAAGGAPGQL